MGPLRGQHHIRLVHRDCKHSVGDRHSKDCRHVLFRIGLASAARCAEGLGAMYVYLAGACRCWTQQSLHVAFAWGPSVSCVVASEWVWGGGACCSKALETAAQKYTQCVFTTGALASPSEDFLRFGDGSPQSLRAVVLRTGSPFRNGGTWRKRPGRVFRRGPCRVHGGGPRRKGRAAPRRQRRNENGWRRNACRPLGTHNGRNAHNGRAATNPASAASVAIAPIPCGATTMGRGGGEREGTTTPVPPPRTGEHYPGAEERAAARRRTRAAERLAWARRCQGNRRVGYRGGARR